jgi:group I intron endonuclease
MIIYKTTNLINGKIYVGKDKNSNSYYLGSGFLLKQAIKKYGKCNFKKETIEECYDENTLNLKEKYWISELKSQTRRIGYNVADGGYGGDTYTNNPNKEEWRIKNGKATLGKKKPHTEETKKKLSISNKLSWQKNPNQGTVGRVWTEEEKSKMREIKKGTILPKKECPYCKRMIDPGNFVQYHGDKCKLKSTT